MANGILRSVSPGLSLFPDGVTLTIMNGSKPVGNLAVSMNTRQSAAHKSFWIGILKAPPALEAKGPSSKLIIV